MTSPGVCGCGAGGDGDRRGLSTLFVPSKRGTRPATTPAGSGGDTTRLAKKPTAITSNQNTEQPVWTRWPVTVDVPVDATRRDARAHVTRAFAGPCSTG